MPNYESYQVIKEITLDLVAPGLAPVVNVPQYDTKGRVVKVNLVSNSAAYEIESDFEVHAVMSKKDGKSVNNPCVVDGSTVYAVISKQMTVFEGRQMVAISITNNSDVELKAFPFVLNVIRAPSDAESYASEDEHLAFQTAYKKVLEAKTAAENAAEAAANSAAAASGSASAASSSAGAAQSNASNAAASAKKSQTSASNAEESATAAENAAEAAADSAAAASGSANAASSSANAAQSNASNAAASAKKSQTSASNAEESATAAKNSKDAAEQAKGDATASKSAAASSAQAASAALAGVQAIVAGNEAYTKAESDAYFMDVRRSLALYIAATKNVLADQNDVAPLCENFFAALHDGKVYGVEFYKHSTSPASAGRKTRDNAALVCEPSTNSKAGRDDYVKRALFCPFNVDYTIDAETLEPKISAIEGVFGTYDAKAPAGLIGVMQQGGWVRYYDAGSSFGYEYADERVSSEFYPLEATVKASDNSVRSFMIHAKYAAGYGADGKLGSLSGAACAIRTISHNSQISLWKQRGAQYCGKSYADGGFVDLMFWLKYGDKANASKMQGCRNYGYTYAITVAQTDAKSVILKKTDAASLVVGSAIDVGDGSDRQNASSYAVASSAVILSIETYDDNNSRVNLDLAAGITTTTSNKINTIAWRSGSCDNVLGVDGSPTNCTSGKEPFIIQGIECMVGAYEVYADAIFKLESADGVFKITPWICKKASEITNNAIGSAYKALSYSLTPPTSAGWRYISSMGFDPAHPCANFPDGLDANSNTGYRAGFYSENATNGLREWLAVGALGNGAHAALGCAYSYTGLGRAWWDISGRACGTAGNRGEFAA